MMKDVYGYREFLEMKGVPLSIGKPWKTLKHMQLWPNMSGLVTKQTTHIHSPKQA
jgi:hypothetical protein